MVIRKGEEVRRAEQEDQSDGERGIQLWCCALLAICPQALITPA